MADMTNVLLQDDTDTTRTFVPVVNEGKMRVWRTDVLELSIVLQDVLTYTWEQLKSGTYRLMIKLEVPIAATPAIMGDPDGYAVAPKAAYTSVGIFTLFAPERSTAHDRADIVRMMAHAICGASAVADTIVNPATGAASAFVGGSSNIQEAFIRLRHPT